MLKTVLIALIRFYQYFLSPWVGNACRFHPSCSNYTLQAIQLHGAIKGTWLGIKRICRCHPWAQGGYDPVPQKKQQDKS
ncbi:membrane protein insertion efficiency factor YidD [Brackiella oedipodis]|uniref:membrane protein insertion efficiency factor YidD n=1 Tax=Brackiella oedipodis TaxID=124225 RepID=UPI001B808657|nr:membrane protein insertion efficiency factor YidD [Brackiella oedipodis]